MNSAHLHLMLNHIPVPQNGFELHAAWLGAY